MRFEEGKVGNVFVAKVLNRRIGADVAPRLQAELGKRMGGENRSLVLDLAAVTLIDSSGLGALIASLKSVRAEDDLVISGARAEVARMFRLTRMDRIFRMYENTDDAVAALP